MSERTVTLIVSDIDDVHFEFVLQSESVRGPRQRAHYHNHTVYELHAVIGGSMRIDMEGREYLLRENDLFVIPPGKMHYIYENPGTDRIGFRFSYSRLHDSGGTLFRQLTAAGNTGREILLHAPSVCTECLVPAVTAFYRNTSDFIIAGLLQTAVLSVFDSVCTLSQPLRTNSNRDMLYMTVVEEYINENYSRRITLDQMSELFHFSRKQTERMMLRLFSKPFSALVNEKRVSIAKFLLLHSDMTMERIALASGFGSVNYFYRKFREHTKETPRGFQKTHGGQ